MRGLSKEEEERRLAAYHAWETDQESADDAGVPYATFYAWRVSRDLPKTRPPVVSKPVDMDPGPDVDLIVRTVQAAGFTAEEFARAVLNAARANPDAPSHPKAPGSCSCEYHEPGCPRAPRRTLASSPNMTAALRYIHDRADAKRDRATRGVPQ